MLYHRLSRFYEPLISPLEKTFLAEKRAAAAELIPDDATVLEIGAGSGLNFKYLSGHSQHVATDISCPMLNIAATKSSSPDLAACDSQLLPFPDNSFDAAIGTLVFCSIPDPDQAFREIRRVLKPNSKLIMFEHVRPPGILGNFFDVMNIATVALMNDYFNRDTTMLARDSGLKVSKVTPSGNGIFELIECIS